MSRSGVDRGGGAVFWLVSGLLAASAVGAIWVVDYVPTNDGPEHVLHAHLVNEWARDSTALEPFVTPTTRVTGRGFGAVFAPLERALPWRTALRLAQSVMVLLWGGALLALAWAIDRRRRWLGLAGLATCFNAVFYFGFFNYYLAQALGILLLSVCWRFRSRLRPLALTVALGCLLVAMAHTFAAIATGLLVVALIVPAAEVGRRARTALVVAASGAPAAAIALLTLIAPIEAGVGDEGVIRQGLLDRVGDLPALAFGLPTGAALVLVLASLGGLALVIATWRHETQAGRRHVGVVVLAVLGLSLVVPFSVRGWQVVSPRLLVLGLSLAWVATPVEALAGRSARLARAAAVVVALAALGLAGWRHVELRERCAPALEALELEVPPGDGVRVALFFQDCQGRGFCAEHADGVPLANDTDHLGALFAVAHGGLPNRFFHGYEGLHPFVLRPDSSYRLTRLDDDWQSLSCVLGSAVEAGDDEGDREATITRLANGLARAGALAESVYLYGRGVDALTPWLQRRGYDILIDEPPHLLARFEGCEVVVELPEAWQQAGETRLAYGWFPDTHPMSAFVWSRDAGPTPPAVALPTSPCGPIWINAWNTLGPDDSRTVCQGAVDGYIAVEVRAPATRVACVPVPME